MRLGFLRVRMSSVRARVLTFLTSMSLFTAFVQWDSAPAIVDGFSGGIKWSGELIKFFKSNTQGLIELILIGLYFEFLGLSKSKDRERTESNATQELLERALASSNSDALLHHALKDRFGSDAAEQIVRNTLKPCPVLRNLTVKISVSNRDEGYTVTVALSYSTTVEKFLVAVTDRPLQCESLIATGLLSEVFVPATEEKGVPATVRKRVKDARTGTYVYHSVRFKELSLRTKKELFKDTVLSKRVAQFKIFEGVSPTLRQAYEGDVTFEISHVCNQSLEHPYTFWLSDRVLEVKSIEIDLRALNERQHAGARIHFFTSSLQWSEDINPDNAVWHFPLQTWLLPGQGVSVVWPPAKAILDSETP